jgi:hypothetical protein
LMEPSMTDETAQATHCLLRCAGEPHLIGIRQWRTRLNLPQPIETGSVAKCETSLLKGRLQCSAKIQTENKVRLEFRAARVDIGIASKFRAFTWHTPIVGIYKIF